VLDVLGPPPTARQAASSSSMEQTVRPGWSVNPSPSRDATEEAALGDVTKRLAEDHDHGVAGPNRALR
jgi:hypothetical protein